MPSALLNTKAWHRQLAPQLGAFLDRRLTRLLKVWDTNPLKDELVGSTNIPFHELTIHTDGGRVKEADAAGARVSPGGVMKTRLKVHQHYARDSLRCHVQ